MMRPLFNTLLLSCLILGTNPLLFAEEAPTHHVHDNAQLLNPKTHIWTEEVLSSYEQATTHQLFVVTFKTYGDEPIDQFANRIADEWKIGYKDLGNGAILFIFQDEHQAWLEVNVGLDNRLPFSFRKKLIDEELAPLFRNLNYDEGVILGIKKLIYEISPEFQVDTQARKNNPYQFPKFLLVFLFVFLIILIIDFFSYLKFSREIAIHPEYIYRMRVGRYSFLEWWLIYGIPVMLFEILYYQLLLSWFNPAWRVNSKGFKKIFWRKKVKPTKFTGSGILGRW